MFAWTVEMENIVLEHLRHIRGTVDTIQSDVRHLNLRMGNLERQYGVVQISEAGQNSEIERLKERLDRVERRLDLRD